jgi:hypothetical protein
MDIFDIAHLLGKEFLKIFHIFAIKFLRPKKLFSGVCKHCYICKDSNNR